MARSEARLLNAIWDDDDFIALSPTQQRAFMFVLSQDDLAHTGVIPLRLRRWSRKAAGLTATELERDLEALEAARFVVIDWDTEELLVRSLMRRDGVFREPNVVRSAIKNVGATESVKILRVLATEVERIRAENPELTRNQDAALSDLEKLLAERVPPQPETSSVRPVGNPTEKGSAKASVIPSEMTTAKSLGGEGNVGRVSNDLPSPQSPNPTPQSLGDALPLDLPERTTKGPSKRDIDAAFERFWEVYPRKVSKGDAVKAWVKVAKLPGIDFDAVIEGAQRYRDDGTRQRNEPQYTKHPATWLNGQCWLDETPGAARASPNGHKPYHNPEDPSIYEGDL